MSSMSSMSSVSKHVHPWQRLRTVFVVGTLLAILVFPTLLPSASSVAHAAAAAVPSGTPSATQTQTNSPATPTPGTVYTVANCVQPPTTIDHAAFTDAQLSTYGMPTRESFPSAAAFAKTVRAMKYRDCQYTIGAPATHYGPATPYGSEMYQNNDHWAGYYEFAGYWSEEISEWTLSAIAVCNASFIGRAANWGGIGGIVNNNLVQSGTTAWCDDPHSQYPNALWYQMWVENVAYDNRPHNDTLQPSPGDLMESIVGQVGGACNYMAVEDVTTGHFFSPPPYGPCGDQRYFDCIEENDPAYGLAVNVYVDYSYCEAYDAPQSKWLVMGNPGSNYWDVTMVNSAQDTIQSTPPNNNGDGGFSVEWNSYH